MGLSEKEVGAIIKSRRKELGFTQFRLAKLSQISQQHISLIEKGSVAPNIKTLEKIFSVLGLKMQFQPGFSQKLIKERLTGLARFNEWEKQEKQKIEPREAFEKAGAFLAAYQTLHPGSEKTAADLEEKKEIWKIWRSRLSLLP